MENSNLNFIIYFSTDNLFRCYNYSDCTYKTISQLPSNISNFKLFKQYDANESGLKQFSEHMIVFRNEILTKCKFDYIEPIILKTGEIMYRNHMNSVMSFFNMFCYDFKTKKFLYADYESIEIDELKWMNLCYNGSVQYVKEGEHRDVYGCDYKAFYQNIMSSDDFLTPYKSGGTKNLQKLPNSLQIGYYRVNISCENANFNKVFMYNKNNVYTHLDIKLARKHQKQYNVKIEIIVEPSNCYVYELKNHIRKFNSVCKNWSNKMTELKSCYPKNLLIKHLSSSLYGALSRKNTIRRSVDEVEEQKLKIGVSDTLDYKILDVYMNPELGEILAYKLQDMKQPLRTNLARIKSFLISAGRCKLAETAIEIGLENVIRMHTDSISSITKFDNTKFENFIEDDKLCGNFLYPKYTNQSVHRI